MMTLAEIEQLRELLRQLKAHAKKHKFQGSYLGDISALRKITLEAERTADPE
jgi:hypothetical protein